MPWPSGHPSPVDDSTRHPGHDASDGSATEYGLSHADLARILPRLWPDASLRGDAANGWHFDLADGRGFSVLPGPELERRIGPIRMPYLHLRVAFRGFSAAEVDAFWTRFHRAFQKGGG